MWCKSNEDNFIKASNALTYLKHLKDNIYKVNVNPPHDKLVPHYVNSRYDVADFMLARLIILCQENSSFKMFVDNNYYYIKLFRKIVDCDNENDFDIDQYALICENMLVSKDSNYILALTSFVKMLASFKEEFYGLTPKEWSIIFVEFYNLFLVVGSCSIILQTYEVFYNLAFKSSVYTDAGDNPRFNPSLIFYNATKYLYKSIEKDFDEDILSNIITT